MWLCVFLTSVARDDQCPFSWPHWGRWGFRFTPDLSYFISWNDSCGQAMLALVPLEWSHAGCCRTCSCKAAAPSSVIRISHNNLQTTTAQIKSPAGTVGVPLSLCVPFLGYPWAGDRAPGLQRKQRECVGEGVLLINGWSWPLSTRHVNVQVDCSLNIKGGWVVCNEVVE